MKPDRQRQLSNLYHDALSRPPQDRRAFLLDACAGDERLRRELESLLRYEPELSGFLATPVASVGAALADDDPAVDMIGRRIGAYQVVGPLGKGGMGEVYRARDSKLDREAAIKVLPMHLTADAERRARLAREARLLATLNHPHIGAIYGLEEVDGVSALVLELVEGPTLAERIERGPLPLSEALAIGRQIADALDAAHAKGIVHRDLKPANVVLQGQPDAYGVRAKVLDFGLATSTPPSSDDGAPTSRPASFDQRGDDGGRIVGTPAYMSPEQARGLTVDKRTDVWAFGCVLFEMLTGRPPFAGASTIETLLQVLEHEPDWGALPSGVPAPVLALLRQCLEKDPVRRIRDVRDAMLRLDGALAEAGTAPPRRAGRGRRLLWIAAGSSALAITAILFVWRAWSMAAPSAPTGRPLPAVPTRLTFGPGLQTDPAWSPDGHRIAFAADRDGGFDIFVQSLEGGEPVRLTHAPGHETEPAWSPDGRRIVFRSDEDGGGLYVVGLDGGAIRRIAGPGSKPAWMPNGRDVAFAGGQMTSLHLVDADGDQSPRPILKHVLETGNYGSFTVHPDGRIGLYGFDRDGRFGFYVSDQEYLQVHSVTSAKPLPDDLRLVVGHAFWNPRGDAVFVEGYTAGLPAIWRVAVDPVTQVWAEAALVTTGTTGAAHPAISPDGRTLAFTTTQNTTRAWVFPFDADRGTPPGRGRPVTDDDASVAGLYVDGAGEAIYYQELRPGKNASPGVRTDLETGQTTVLVADSNSGPRPSPDGSGTSYLLYRIPAGGRSDVEYALAWRDRQGRERLLSPWGTAVLPTDVRRDGRAVLGSWMRRAFTGPAPLVEWPVAAAPVAQPGRVLLEASDKQFWQGHYSPDGRWVSFVVASLRSGETQLGITPAGSDRAQTWTRVAADHPVPDKPRWSPDGRILYFVSRDAGGFLDVWGIRIDPMRGTTIGAPFKVVEFDSPRWHIDPDLPSLEIGVGRDVLALPMRTVKGSIWTLALGGS